MTLKWLDTYIGKLLALYGCMLLVIALIAVPSFYYRYQQQQLAVQAMAAPVCRQCIYDDMLVSGSRADLLSYLDARLDTEKLGYGLFNTDKSLIQGVLHIEQMDFSIAQREHFAFTDLPYHVSHNMETDIMQTLFKLKDDSYLLLEEKMSGNPESADYQISQLETRISQNAIASAAFITAMVVLAFIFTALVGWKVHQKIRKISQTSASIINNMDLSKRIPLEHQGNEFNQLAGQLNTMLDAIESRVNDITAMSNMLAHELKTPLTRFKHKLLLATETSAESANHEPDNELYDDLHRDFDKIMATFDTSLRICRLESGNAHVHPSTVNLVDMVENARELLLPLASENKQTIVCDILCKQGILDGNLIAQALVNLLENAIRYAGEFAEIKITTVSSDKLYEISVTDTGKGMTEKQLNNATGLYVRGVEHAHGVGLGLHMVQAIAVAHQGELVLENKANGFEAKLLLPVQNQKD